MTRIHDWIWNVLFLDFYLDKRWTFRFKLMNLISGDTLRPMLCSAYSNFSRLYDDPGMPTLSDPRKRIYMNRGLREVNQMWEYYHK